MSVGVGSPNLSGPYRVKDLIRDSYVLAKILGRGETMSLVQMAPAFRTLGDLIEQAKIEKTFSSYQTEIAVPLQADKLSYTIGPSTASPPGEIEAVRPIEVLNGFSRRSGNDLPVYVTHAKEDYDRIQYKSLTGSTWSIAAYYQASFPCGTIYVYPKPSDSLTTLYLTVLSSIAQFVGLEDEVSLPEGYLQYLKYALAKRIAGGIGMIFGQENEQILDRCEKALQGNNIKAFPIANTGLVGLASSGSTYDVRSDLMRGR